MTKLPSMPGPWRALLGIGLICVSLAGPVARAGVPSTIAFQGYLTDSVGEPVNGAVDLVFALYDAPTGGTSLWTESRTAVSVAEGVFQVALGSVTPFPTTAFDEAPRHLGIRVEGEPEMPRTELRAAPFALEAREAGTVTDGISLTEDGVVTLDTNTAPAAGMQLRWHNQLNAADLVFLGASAVDGASFLMLMEGQSDVRWFLDANDGGDPRLFGSGPTQIIDIDLGVVGDGSVQLPRDAVSASEVLDEPGLASNNDTGLTALTSATPASVISRTITPPANGYVLALGQSAIRVTHTQGTSTEGAIGLSDDGTSFGTAQDVNVQISSNAPSGPYAIPAHVNGVFTVSGGVPKTIHIVAVEANGNINVEDLSLTLLFVPTSYGTVDPTLMIPAGVDRDETPHAPQSGADIRAEVEESRQWNTERMARELAEIQAQVERLRREVAQARDGGE